MCFNSCAVIRTFSIRTYCFPFSDTPAIIVPFVRLAVTAGCSVLVFVAIVAAAVIIRRAGLRRPVAEGVFVKRSIVTRSCVSWLFHVFTDFSVTFQHRVASVEAFTASSFLYLSLRFVVYLCDPMCLHTLRHSNIFCEILSIF